LLCDEGFSLALTLCHFGGFKSADLTIYLVSSKIVEFP
jgi:hypothetical protein